MSGECRLPAIRRAALSEGLLVEIEAWRIVSINTDNKAWVFPSERMTPLAMENVWRRNIGPKLDEVGLDWVNFQVMRRTHSSLMGDLGVNASSWLINVATVSTSQRTSIVKHRSRVGKKLLVALRRFWPKGVLTVFRIFGGFGTY